MRCRTEVVWSWAVTSERVLGRLEGVSGWGRMDWRTDYFSTQGCWPALSGLVEVPRAELAAAAAAARALLLKKSAMVAWEGWVAGFGVERWLDATRSHFTKSEHLIGRAWSQPCSSKTS